MRRTTAEKTVVVTRKVAYPIDRLFRPRRRFLVRPLAVSLLAGSAILIPSRAEPSSVAAWVVPGPFPRPAAREHHCCG